MKKALLFLFLIGTFLGFQNRVSAEILIDFMTKGQSFQNDNKTVFVTAEYSTKQKVLMQTAIDYWNDISNNTILYNGQNHTIHFLL